VFGGGGGGVWEVFCGGGGSGGGGGGGRVRWRGVVVKNRKGLLVPSSQGRKVDQTAESPGFRGSRKVGYLRSWDKKAQNFSNRVLGEG